MKIKQISDSTIKITIKLEDLEEHGMEIEDFLVPQEKTEDFFYAILDELEMPENFLDSGMLSFRVTPKPDRLDVFVTKSNVDQNLKLEDLSDLSDNLEDLSQLSPDDFFKTIEKTMIDKGVHKREHADEQLLSKKRASNQGQQDKKVISGDQLVDKKHRYVCYVLKFKDLHSATTFAKTVDYPVDTSELYKMEGCYYLTILVDFEGCSEFYPTWLLARMREHADDTGISRSFLQEHGRLLLVSDAVVSLGKV